MSTNPVTPLTEAQLAFLTEQTERAARKSAREAVRGYRNSALVGFAILLGGLGGGFWAQQHDASEARNAIVISGRNVAVSGCNDRFRQQQVIRGIIRSGSKQIDRYESEGTLTPAQGKRAQIENRKSVRKVKLPDCRLQRDLLTDDPRSLKPDVPAPLYPGRKG